MLSAELLSAFLEIVGPRGLITAQNQLQTYECDGLTAFREAPSAVLLPETTGQVQAILRLCTRHKVPFVARGAGTGLSGGALPTQGSIVIGFSRMTKILNVDLVNHQITVQPGVINANVTVAVAGAGFFYAPDPSSQTVCTIGGNVAENAGGAHCLKYGFTVTHVLEATVVLPSGELVTLGSKSPDAPGYDLLGVFIGSEGTLGIATEMTLRIVRKPEAIQVLLAAFPSISAAAQTVSDIIAAGLLPSAMEIMDRLAIVAAEAAVHPQYPMCDGLLIVEVDGPLAEVKLQAEQVLELCRKNGAIETRHAIDEGDRLLIWKGRKAAFAAAGRLSPNYIVQDGVIPRTTLPVVLEKIAAMANAEGLRVTNVFHAGDGNLHPIVLYRRDNPGEEERAIDLSMRILDLCVETGGSITGEHGVGREKQCSMSYMYAPADLATMQRVRRAFDPDNIANPEKLFPTPRLCGEQKRGHYVPHPVEASGIAEVF
ncbi:FAD-binding protein [Terriglobus albidus]|uniref:FAD-binding protein n=1 Tax=Terriglobus albidus TaxID=1592106 RepID=A0A5B9ECS8_9BACT|nr:FAD-linked oxidase C-terminal domain-containing protein [Terriglobus albidus]QEE30018.1 FAD-binding protein [Terriglobus albidus]